MFLFAAWHFQGLGQVVGCWDVSLEGIQFSIQTT